MIKTNYDHDLNLYPVLMQHKIDKQIVLFKSLQTGTVLFKGSAILEVGKFYIDFMPCTNAIWERLTNALILTNV